VKQVPTRWVVIGVAVVALILAGVVSFYASSSPDGLNRVAADKGFSSTERTHTSDGSPLAGYESKGVDNPRVSKAVAGITGTAIVLVLAGGLTLLVRRRQPTRA
jgi:cobalt/nickel transport protein